MAQLPRVTQKLFATSGVNQTAVFGTMKTGSPTYSADIATLMSGVAWQEGWNSAVTAGYAPFMEEFNAIEKINTQQIAYILQSGIPEWDSATDYYIGDIVKVVSGSDAVLYCAIASSTNQDPTSTIGYWTIYFSENKILSDVLNAIYPVNSIYAGTQSTCPLATLMVGSTWVLVASNVVTGLQSTAAVVGNGTTIGLTDGTNNLGMQAGSSNSIYLSGRADSYGTSVGSAYGNATAVNKSVGLTEEGDKSGIVADLSSATTNLTLNIWKRTA